MVNIKGYHELHQIFPVRKNHLFLNTFSSRAPLVLGKQPSPTLLPPPLAQLYTPPLALRSRKRVISLGFSQTSSEATSFLLTKFTASIQQSRNTSTLLWKITGSISSSTPAPQLGLSNFNSLNSLSSAPPPVPACSLPHSVLASV